MNREDLIRVLEGNISLGIQMSTITQKEMLDALYEANAMEGYLEDRIQTYKRAQRQAHKALRRKNKIIRKLRAQWLGLRDLLNANIP